MAVIVCGIDMGMISGLPVYICTAVILYADWFGCVGSKTASILSGRDLGREGIRRDVAWTSLLEVMRLAGIYIFVSDQHNKQGCSCYMACRGRRYGS